MTQKDDKLTWGIVALLLSIAALLVFVVWFALDMAILGPQRLAKQSEAWIEVPCTVNISKVEAASTKSTGSKGSSLKRSKPVYAPRVEFEYQWQGKTYISNRFWFGSGFWKVKSEAAAVIAPYRQGNRAVCYVDPADPTQAVLTRDIFMRPMVGGVWVTTLVLSGLTIVGGLVCSSIYLNRRVVSLPPAEASQSVDATAQAPEQAPTSTPAPTLVTVVRAWMIAVIWNGGWGLIAYFSWVGGAPMSFFIFFLSIFFLIGLIMLTVAILATIESVRRKLFFWPH